MTAEAQDNGWADNVDYGDDDDDNDDEEVNMQSAGWADEVDYGDDDDEPMIDDDEDGIGDLGLTDDEDLDDLPPDNALGGPAQQQFKSEITSELDNPNKVGRSYKLEFDAKDTPADISDDDETAPGLRINQFQLLAADDADHKGLVMYTQSIWFSKMQKTCKVHYIL